MYGMILDLIYGYNFTKLHKVYMQRRSLFLKKTWPVILILPFDEVQLRESNFVSSFVLFTWQNHQMTLANLLMLSH